MKKIILILVTAFSVISISSCRGNDGENGEQGPAGQDGNANVFSKTFAGNEITWNAGTNFGTQVRRAVLPVNEITQDIIDNGVVLVYVKINTESQTGSSTWTLLPITLVEFNVTHYLASNIYLNKVELVLSNNNNSVPVNPVIPIHVVVIKGGVAGKAASSGVDFKKFEQVQSYFQLKD